MNYRMRDHAAGVSRIAAMRWLSRRREFEVWDKTFLLGSFTRVKEDVFNISLAGVSSSELQIRVVYSNTCNDSEFIGVHHLAGDGLSQTEELQWEPCD